MPPALPFLNSATPGPVARRMRTAWIAKQWDRIRSSFWFVPAVMSGASAALAYGALAMDRGAPGRWLRDRGWGYGGSAEGASLVLQTISASMMTVAGVVFSLTLVALSLASRQFGPRLLRNFMRDATNQSVLGAFVATFLYCVLVLLAVRRPPDEPFVPQLAVGVAVVLALASMTVLVYFIHHVSVSIQADEMVARVGAELERRIDVLFPQRVGHAPQVQDGGASGVLPDGFERDAGPVPAHDEGYLQLVDAGALMQLATGRDLVLRLLAHPGDYVVRGAPLLLAWPSARVDEAARRAMNDAFALGNQRTPSQDAAFGFQQLVEIAVRAMSPAMNDPFTAVACIDRIESSLHRLAGRAIPSPNRLDDRGRLRVVARAATFPELLAHAFDPLREHARPAGMVTLRLLDALAALARTVQRPGDLAAVRRQVECIGLAVERHADDEDTRARLRARCEAILGACRGR